MPDPLQIVPLDMSLIRADRDGWIGSTPVAVGSHVEVGDVVAEMTPSDDDVRYEARLAVGKSVYQAWARDHDPDDPNSLDWRMRNLILSKMGDGVARAGRYSHANKITVAPCNSVGIDCQAKGYEAWKQAWLAIAAGQASLQDQEELANASVRELEERLEATLRNFELLRVIRSEIETLLTVEERVLAQRLDRRYLRSTRRGTVLRLNVVPGAAVFRGSIVAEVK